MEKYIIINRFIMHDCGIDWTNSCGVADTYEKAFEIFCAEKENLLQSMSDYSKSVIKDDDNIFHIQYVGKDLFPACRYVKIISLY